MFIQLPAHCPPFVYVTTSESKKRSRSDSSTEPKKAARTDFHEQYNKLYIPGGHQLFSHSDCALDDAGDDERVDNEDDYLDVDEEYTTDTENDCTVGKDTATALAEGCPSNAERDCRIKMPLATAAENAQYKPFKSDPIALHMQLEFRFQLVVAVDTADGLPIDATDIFGGRLTVEEKVEELYLKALTFFGIKAEVN